MTDRKLLALTAQIVARYVETHQTPPQDLPSLIGLVRDSLGRQGRLDPVRVEIDRPSAAEIRRSVRRDSLVSFLNGKPYKCLKKHIGGYGLTPEAYRTKFSLPSDYPVVAAEYSDRRSAMAKASGLGRRTNRRKGAADNGAKAVRRK